MLLRYKSARDALLVPARVRKGAFPGAMTGGIFDREGVYLEESTLLRNGRRFVDAPGRQLYSDTKSISGPVIFGGYLYNHFGHFLLESLARLHLCASFRETPIVWLKEREIKPWQSEIFRLLGIRNDHIFLVEPTRVAEVLIGECGFSIGSFFKPFQAEFVGCQEYSVVPGRKIWLSRSALAPTLGGIENEGEIEEELRGRGWIIFQAEKHSIEEQIAALGTAEHIAGFEGSAFHLIMLLRVVYARIDIFVRGDELNRNFQLIGDAKGLDQRVHHLEMEKIGGDRSFARFRVLHSQAVPRLLDQM